MSRALHRNGLFYEGVAKRDALVYYSKVAKCDLFDDRSVSDME